MRDILKLRKNKVYYISFIFMYLFIFLINKLSKISFPFGRISYQSLFTIEYLSKLNISQTFNPFIFDPLTKTIEKMVVTPYEQMSVVLIKLFNFLGLNVGPEFVVSILSFLFFSLSIYFLLEILNKLNIQNKNKSLFMFVFLISPITLFLLITFSYHVFSFMLTLLLINICLSSIKETKKIIFMSLISFVLLFFGIFYLINLLFIFGFLMWLYRNEKEKSEYLKKFFFVLLSVFIFGSLVFKFNIYEQLISFSGPEVFFIYDLGGKIGFSIFTFVLFLIGLIGLIKKKEKNYFYYFLFLLGVLNYFLFGPTTLIYINPLVCFFASETFIKFMKYHKGEKIIKQLTTYSILLGLLFSGLSFVFELENLTLNEEAKNCLIELREMEDGLVLSDYRNGYFIKSISNKQIILDDLSIINKRNEVIYNEMKRVFYSSNLDEIKGFIKKYDIKYFMITDKMIYKDIWRKEDQKLVFVLGNKDNFKKICSFDEQGGIWEYIGD